ncbi:MAG: ATP-binding protein [Peptococcaceae bacterium]|jgi:hypothetical protein|nr:ATP-binding protein [Peptococcaceae bacterium]
MKRILIVAGHYGSGKTEFSVNLAVYAAQNGSFGYSKTAVVDLDVVNPYFRSRERGDALAELGVKVYGSIYGGSVTAEIPELSAEVRAPLEDRDAFVIVDAGGNEAGARVLGQFRKYFTPAESSLYIVLNASRPETRTVAGAIRHLAAIESELGKKADGLINNTHLLRETTAADILQGRLLCLAVSKEAGIPFVCSCYPAPVLRRDELPPTEEPLMPLDLYMRDSWLDK